MAHFGQFEEAAKLAAQIGKQSGGWQQKTAGRSRAQEGQPGAVASSPAAPGSKPAATPQANPASLSARTAFAAAPFTPTKGGGGYEATP